jgi:cob(I)alamin adenosyltransferase
MLATPTNKQTLKNGEQRLNIPEVDTKSVTYLEKEIDKMNSTLPKMTHFILPGGHTTVSFCHIARCVCRRAERLSVSLHEQEGVNPITLTYLNRLSDFLFMLARKLSQDLSVQEVKWIPEKL